MRSVIIPERHPMLSDANRSMPAPFALVLVKHITSHRTLPPLLAILDTGADWSQLAPWTRESMREVFCVVCDRFECHHLNDAEEVEACDRLCFSFDRGAHWYYPAGLVECTRNSATWRGPERGEGEDLIIGRDVLHRLQFTYFGPDEQFTLIDPAIP